MEIALTHAAVLRAVDDLGVAAERLGDGEGQAHRVVCDLLDGGWSGEAAAAWAEAWVQWRAGAREATDGLLTTRRLLEAAHHDLVATDDHTESRLRELGVRVLARLG